jgi:hypothetical protein
MKAKPNLARVGTIKEKDFTDMTPCNATISFLSKLKW